MKKDLIDILTRIRGILINDGIAHLDLKNVSEKLGLSVDDLHTYFEDDRDLISKLLAFERRGFKVIFEENDFEGVNAIDIMMTVSKELAQKYDYITPSYSAEVKEYFPDIYEEHFERRRDFIFEKIQINLRKGIGQGWYRSDLSIELISRLYMSRLMDMHNPDFFPPEKFSFDTLFELMFDNLIRSIATGEGLKYYQEKIKRMEFN